MPANHDPILTSFFLADRMIRDQIAQKWGAIGLHCGYGNVPGLPLFVPEVWFFLRVADAPDVVHLTGVITSPSGVVIQRREWDFNRTEHPEAGPMNAWWEIGGRFVEVIFPEAGRYAVDVWMGGTHLGETPLYIGLAPRP